MTRMAFLASTALALGTAAAHAQINVYGEGSSLAAPTYQAEFAKYGSPVGGFSGHFFSTSSGKGYTAFETNTGTAGSGVPSGLPVDFAGSDAFLTSTQVSTYNAANQAVTGPIIQIPVLGVAIAIPFQNPSYKGTNGSGLKMTDADLCAALSGKATSWGQLSSLAQGGSKAKFVIVYRSDNSGTSFLLTQHLKAVCTTANSAFTSADLASMPRTDFYNLSVVTKLNANGGIGAAGSAAVATALQGQTSAIGYLSPDFTDVVATPAKGFGTLKAASLRSPNGTYYQPNYVNTSAALSAAQKNGVNVSAPATAAAAKNPLNWVPQLPLPQAGYPIVGYTNWFLATCYQGGKAPAIVSFLKTHYQANGPLKTTVTNNGFLPTTNASYITALNKYILSNSGAANVDIGDATVCKGKKGR